MKIQLSLTELLMASDIGRMRQLTALKRKLQDKHGAQKENGWQLHIEGACGEMAAGKALGIHWEGSVCTFKRGGDVGSLQVRTRSQGHYELIVRKDDRDEDVFILVTGMAPNYEVKGWITGADAKQERWLQRHGGREAAFFVPTTELKSLEDIPR